ncbi:hypothetical protein JCM19046_4471 [Bacillus sp. JCM 19046]|nr:hypothetical protein JCM19046_4471 [Bacillus sp. JCM 19046]
MELESSQGVTYEEGIDLRPQLYEESPYVPLFSVPYTYHPMKVSNTIRDFTTKMNKDGLECPLQK